MRRVPVEPYLARGRSWWDARSERERRLLAALAGLAAMTLLVLLVIRPMQLARARALSDIRTYETLNGRLRGAGALVGRRTAGGPLPTVVTGSAATAGLTIQRLEPEGGQTRVVIENAPYDAIVSWLSVLENSDGVHIAEVKLERRPTPGIVGAQLLLSR